MNYNYKGFWLKDGRFTYPVTATVAPEQILKWGGVHRSRTKVGCIDPAWSAEKKCLSSPPLFGSKSTIRRFGERFRDGQYSLVSLLFAVLLITVPSRAQPFVKVGGTCPPCPIESAPLVSHFYVALFSNSFSRIIKFLSR